MRPAQRYDPENGPAIHNPSVAEAIDIIDRMVGPDREWNRENIAAALLKMDATPKGTTAARAVTVVETWLEKKVKATDPLGELVRARRPQHDMELNDIVTVR